MPELSDLAKQLLADHAEEQLPEKLPTGSFDGGTRVTPRETDLDVEADPTKIIDALRHLRR